MKNLTLVIIFLFLFWQPIAHAETENGKENPIDLSVEPRKVLFDLTNLKPGDSVARFLKVLNNGDEDFEYVINNDFTGGSKEFYNKLELRIEDSKDVIYEGLLHNFKKLDSRVLKYKQIEELLFFIEIPMELTNEFQGLSTNFEFKIYVEGTLGGIIPVDNRLPETATNMFNYLIAGAALITGGGALLIHQKRKKLKQEK
jgi:LPXTG-motif cell wall-anchored protein